MIRKICLLIFLLAVLCSSALGTTLVRSGNYSEGWVSFEIFALNDTGLVTTPDSVLVLVFRDSSATNAVTYSSFCDDANWADSSWLDSLTYRGTKHYYFRQQIGVLDNAIAQPGGYHGTVWAFADGQGTPNKFSFQIIDSTTALSVALNNLDAAISSRSVLTATDNIGINWADVSNPTATLGLSGTTIGTVTTTGTATNVGTVTGNVNGNVGGNVTGSVGSVATGGITRGSFATSAIGPPVVDESTYIAFSDTMSHRLADTTAQARAFWRADSNHYARADSGATMGRVVLEGIGAGGSSNWSDAQRDSALNAIADIGKLGRLTTALGYDADSSISAFVRWLLIATGYDADTSLSTFTRYNWNKTKNLPTNPASGTGLDSLRTTLGYDADSTISMFVRYLLTVTGYDTDSSLSAFVRYIHNKTINLPTSPFGRSGSDSLATVMNRIYSYLTATPFTRSGSDSLAGVMSRLYSYLNAIPGNFSRTGSDSLATVMNRIYSYLTVTPFSRTASDSLATALNRIYTYLTVTPFSRSASDSLASTMNKVYSYLDATISSRLAPSGTLAHVTAIDTGAIARTSFVDAALAGNKFPSNTFDSTKFSTTFKRMLQNWLWANVDSTLADTSLIGKWLSYISAVGGGGSVPESLLAIVTLLDQFYAFTHDTTFSVSDTNSFGSNTFVKMVAKLDSLIKVMGYDDDSSLALFARYIYNKTKHLGFYNDTTVYGYMANASGTAPTVAQIAAGVLSCKSDTFTSAPTIGSYIRRTHDTTATQLNGTISSRFARVASDSLAGVMSRIYSYLNATAFTRAGSDSLATVMNRIYTYLTVTPFSRSASDSLATAMNRIYSYVTSSLFTRSGSDSLATVMNRVYSYLTVTPFSRSASDSLATVMSRIYTYLTASPPTTSQMADGVWNEDSTGHLTAGTMGSSASQVGTDGGTSSVDTNQVMRAAKRAIIHVFQDSSGQYHTYIDTTGFLLAGAGAGASATEIADTLKNRGYMFGTGWQVCSLLVLDQSNNPVPNIPLQIKGWTGTAIGTRITGATGKASFLLDTTDYKVYVYSVTYPQINTYDTFAVRASHLYDTVKVTTFSPGTAPSPYLCRVYGWVNNLSGVGDSGAIVQARIKTAPLRYSTTIISPYQKRDTTNSQGYFYLDLYPDTLLTPSGTHYEFMIFKTDGTIFKDTSIVVPDSTCWQLTW